MTRFLLRDKKEYFFVSGEVLPIDIGGHIRIGRFHGLPDADGALVLVKSFPVLWEKASVVGIATGP